MESKEAKRDYENITITTVYQELSTFELFELTRLYNHLAEYGGSVAGA